MTSTTVAAHASGPYVPEAVGEVALLDLDGVIVGVNTAWQRFCLANGGNLAACGPGRSYLEICDGARDHGSRAVARAIRAALAETGPVIAKITIGCHSPASDRWLDVLVSSRIDDGGRCVGATVALLPAGGSTASAGTDPALDRLVMDLLDETSDAVSVIDAATGRRVYANRTVCEHTGLSLAELLRADVPIGRPAAPEDRPRILAAIRAVVARELPEALLDATVVHRDGSRRAIELKISYRPAEPGRPGSGHVILTARDVSDRVRHSALAELAVRVTTLVLAGAEHEQLHDEITSATARIFEADAEVFDTPPLPSLPPGRSCDHVVVAMLGRGTSGPGHALRLTRPASAPPFSPAERAQIEAFAHQKNASVELGHARAEAARLALLDDRQRIARDLHDTVIQDLIATGMQLQSFARHEDDPGRARTAAALVDQLDDAVRMLRTSVFRLNRPPQDAPLGAILPHLVSDAGRVMGHTPTLTVRGDLDRVPPKVADAVAAVLRECLSNVARHAGATKTSVRLLIDEDRLRLDVQDDGVGRSPDAPPGNGLRNLADRASELGGWVDVGAVGPRGTRVRWQVPLVNCACGRAQQAVDTTGVT